MQASVGTAEIIDATLFIGKNVVLLTVCSSATRYLYDKLHKNKDEIDGWMIEKKIAKNNPNDIAQAFLKEIERLEKAKV